MEIKEFILKNVRCFAGEQAVRLAPLTFLIGENSTGKSTVLGCFNALLNQSNKKFGSYDFNESPYELGTYAEIARESKKTFELGYKLSPNKSNNLMAVYVAFSNNKNVVIAKQVRNVFPDGEIIIMRGGKTSKKANNLLLPFSIEKKGNKFIIECEERISDLLSLEGIVRFIHLFFEEMRETDESKSNIINQFEHFCEQNLIDQKVLQSREKGHVSFMLSSLEYLTDNCKVISLAPIRSKPKRTYDPINNTPTPEGDDVPNYLMRLKRQEDEQEIIESLHEFGKASGLFDSIDVKTYGENMNEPFQIQVEVRKKQSNLLDVGYGISQILPILVRVFADKEKATMLLQQPEVHLHPRAQAELSSLFVNATKERKQSFIIETHSDAMIDRARIEVMRGNIKPEDLSLVYFEAKDDSVRIHNIKCDKEGNLLNVPQGYREFFIKESDKLMGFLD